MKALNNGIKPSKVSGILLLTLSLLIIMSFALSFPAFAEETSADGIGVVSRHWDAGEKGSSQQDSEANEESTEENGNLTSSETTEPNNALPAQTDQTAPDNNEPAELSETAGENNEPAENAVTAADNDEPAGADAASEADGEDTSDTPEAVGNTGTKKLFDFGSKRSVFIILALVLVIIAVILTAILISRIKKEKSASAREKTVERTVLFADNGHRTTVNKNGVYVGMIHNQGRRKNQEDSLGTEDFGRIYIVADGMGGLSSGDKVSQTIVCSMLSMSQSLRNDQFDGVLPEMVSQVTEKVNNMLGRDGIYKSGSTLIAVLLRGNRFHWISVGDSHIYFYHRNMLNLLNQEHNLRQENLRRVLEGSMTREDAALAKNLGGLTSFVGMGELKYVEKSIRSIPLEKGDRIALMTDGVFNELSENAIADILYRYPDVQDAADEIEKAVLKRADAQQDNFTALIIGA